MASVKANPKIAILKSSSLKEGFLEIPTTNAPNTVPIPTPAPANPMVASPAPKNLADCNKTINFLIRLCIYLIYKFFTLRKLLKV